MAPVEGKNPLVSTCPDFRFAASHGFEAQELLEARQQAEERVEKAKKILEAADEESKEMLGAKRDAWVWLKK